MASNHERYTPFRRRSDKFAIASDRLPGELSMRCTCSMLFVEDSYLLAQSAVLALGDAGLHVHPVPDAQSALGVFVQRRFDCAVIDVELPGGMDGVELARRLLQLRPDLPIALATGYDATRCGAPPDIPVFQKPYRFEDITSSVCPRVQALAQR